MSPYNLPDRDPSLVPDFVRALPEDGHGQLAIFDADGTLWRDDVADDFCRWMIDNGHVETGDRWPEYIQVYRDDHGEGCEYMLSFYEGLKRKRFHELIRHWWRRADRHWIPEVLESLYYLAEHDYMVWIVTGSPTGTMMPLIEILPIGGIVGLDFEVVDGVITGRLAGIRCTDEGKAEKVRHLWGDGPIPLAAGNGVLDSAMISMAETVRWSVFPNPEFEQFSHDQGWYVLPRPADFVEELKLRP